MSITTSAISSPPMSSNEVQTILRLKNKNDGIGPLKLALSSQAVLLESIAKRIASESLSTKHLLLTTGLGLSLKPGIPMRLPALLVPGLRLMQTLQDKGRPAPTYLVYQVTDFIAGANGIPAGQARSTSAAMERYLRDYVRVLHPSLKDHVLFRFGNDSTPAVRAAIDSITDGIRSGIATGLVTGQNVQALLQGEKKHSAREEQAYRYGAANALFNGADAVRYPFADDAGQMDAQVIFPIGGKAEKPFFDLTDQVASKHSPERPVIPLFTSVGSRPTYYPYPECGDPCSPGELAKGSGDATIRGDFAVLTADGATPDLLRSIFPTHS